MYVCQVIVFSFSKKECEALALQMAPLDLNDEEERKVVDSVFWNAVECLSEDDRRLPQVCAWLPNKDPSMLCLGVPLNATIRTSAAFPRWLGGRLLD